MNNLNENTTTSTTNDNLMNSTALFDSSMNQKKTNSTIEVSLSSIKEFLASKGGKCKYNELLNYFKDSLAESGHEGKFQEFLSNIAVKKYENDSSEEWIVLKKKYQENISPSHSGFFASTLQKTKQNFTKFSNKAFSSSKDKESTTSINLNSSSGNKFSVLSPILPILAVNSSLTNLSTSNKEDNSIEHENEKQTDSKNNEFEMFNSLSKSPKRSSSLIILDKKTNHNISDSSTSKDDSSSLLTNVLDKNLKSTDQSSNKLNNDLNIQTNKLSQSHSLQSITNAIEQSSNVKSVKEHAKKLNRLNTESELKSKLNNSDMSSISSNSSSNLSYNNKNFKANKNVEIECFDFTDPKPNEKEWIMICSRGDYMEMVKILNKQPYLAQKKDPFNTCVHWACKYGNIDIIKLVASTLDNDTKTNPKSLRIKDLINSRTGYTCLHIAYMYNHSELVPYLKTYGAEPLTDYNGKNGIDYSKSSCIFDHHITIELNDTKLHSPDLINDANTLVKRSSSVLVQSKEKEIKDETGYSTLKLTDSRSGLRSKIINSNMNESPFRQNKPVLAHSSPLNPIETSSASNILMPPPKTTVVMRSKPINPERRKQSNNRARV